MTDLLPHLSILLPPARLAELEPLRARLYSDEALAAELVRRGWLTPLQGRWLLRGHGRRLVVGHYLIHKRIGTGGMGEVFLAHHRRMGRDAALKVVRVDRRDDERHRARFIREVRALGRLSHPNVVHAYDAGAVRRTLYLAMEFVPGPDLGQLVDSNGPLEPGSACEYMRQAALGLSHMHRRGLVHRDVKPSNLGLAGGGAEVKVLDVGLVKDRIPEAEPDGELTRDGHLVGSPDYAAPEQVADSRGADHRADQYALGCTLYHLLTGRVPFVGGTAVKKALQRLTEDPPPAEELRPGLPAGLGKLLRRLLAREPRRRFPDMASAAAALVPFATPVLTPVAPAPLAAGDTAHTLPTCPDVRLE